jgi:hypothetical protein
VAVTAPVDPEAAYTSVVPDRVQLMGTLRSYDSVQIVSDQLQKGGYTSKSSQITKPKMRHYPPFRTDTLDIDGYKHLGQAGHLTLEFFNDRLYQAYFIPDKPAAYLALLRKSGVPLKREESSRSVLTQGNLHMESNIDFASSDVGMQMHSNPYIYWRDERLFNQFKDWGPLP